MVHCAECLSALEVEAYLDGSCAGHSLCSAQGRSCRECEAEAEEQSEGARPARPHGWRRLQRPSHWAEPLYPDSATVLGRCHCMYGADSAPVISVNVPSYVLRARPLLSAVERPPNYSGQV